MHPAATQAQRSKRIDGKLVRALIALPAAVSGECEIDDYHSLAVRDLQRGQGVGLPSGEAVAHHMGIAPLTAEQIGISSTGWHYETPLWYYILREADACTGGNRLGPVGGRIVAEVLVGPIDADLTSYRRNSREWQPRKTFIELLASYRRGRFLAHQWRRDLAFVSSFPNHPAVASNQFSLFLLSSMSGMWRVYIVRLGMVSQSSSQVCHIEYKRSMA